MKSAHEPDPLPGSVPVGNSDELTLDELDMVIGGLAQEWWEDRVWQIMDPEANRPQ